MTTAQVVQISVNGESVEIPASQTVLTLLEILQIAPDRVAVELNKSIIRKRDWETTEVTGGAAIEIVEFVGGG